MLLILIVRKPNFETMKLFLLSTKLTVVVEVVQTVYAFIMIRTVDVTDDFDSSSFLSLLRTVLSSPFMRAICSFWVDNKSAKSDITF